ncbi:MAG: single-stranded-DNA-specific exonuclease RecJ, partial [Spirochaetes bacterium GWB1_27_13]
MNRVKKELNVDFINKWMKKGLNPIILSILSRRDTTKEEDLLDFLYPTFENIYSPYIFENISVAYQRIDLAIKNNEKIIIFGDRDVDGTTSTAIIFKFLKLLNANVSWEVPLGEDLYGLHKNKFTDWSEKKYSLCITVDCGITNIGEVEELKKIGIETIIIDHHKPLDNKPDAVCIINPKCEKSLSFTDIAACGVSFLFVYGYLIYKNKIFNKKIALIYSYNNQIKLDIYQNLICTHSLNLSSLNEILESHFDYYFLYSDKQVDLTKIKNIVEQKKINIISNNFPKDSFVSLLENTGLRAKLNLFKIILKSIDKLEDIKSNFLPLAMLGLIADIMPLHKTNRIIVKYGMEYLKQQKLTNLIKLCEKIKFDYSTANAKDISWQLCPILNSSGRMGSANQTVNFLIAEDNLTEIIDLMIVNNELRKKKGEEAYNSFIDKLEENKFLYENKLTFFYSEEIHKGITGITANKLASETNCPTIVAAIEGDYFTGSIRGKSDHHFVDFLQKASSILEEFGGHKAAAGFRFRKERLDSFKNFLKLNAKFFSQEVKDENVYIDAEIPYEYLNYDLFKIINILEPYGEA